MFGIKINYYYYHSFKAKAWLELSKSRDLLTTAWWGKSVGLCNFEDTHLKQTKITSMSQSLKKYNEGSICFYTHFLKPGT